MKKILSVVVLMMSAWIFQHAAGQGSIVMGSAGSYMFFGAVDDQPIYFYDPGGPDGYFDQGCRDTVTLRTNMTNTQLYVLFEDFVMDAGDTLWIFDGDMSDCDDAHLLGVYNLVNSPEELYATGRSMTFVFHSDSMETPGLKDGWKAQVYAYETVPYEINYGELASVLTCNALFYDAGGPNGNINANGTPANNFTEFTSPLGTHIKCMFTQFSVNGVLKIYDGIYNDPNKRLIGQFCTSTLDASTNNMPPVLFSSTNTLAFEYVSGTGDANKVGWRAEISCVPELFESDGGSPCLGISNKPLGDYADAANLEVIELDTLHPTVVLQANVTDIGSYTNDYKVEQIPYDENTMLFAYNEGVSVGAIADDRWLSGVQLPFIFNFFGKLYSTVYSGTNGLISMSPQSDFCEYSYSTPPASPPYSSIPYKYKNCVYGVYEDIDCRYYTNKNDGLGLGDIRCDVLGDYPCRAFVFNYLNVGLYGLTSSNTGNQFDNYNTYQMVLYEGTNIIDVYVKHRKCCATTNQQGEGVIGLQNSTSSQILLAPGRGMTGWNVDNEAWRFTPITPLDENGELTWYQDMVDENHVISHGFQRQNRVIAVMPTETTSYISEYKFTNAAGDLFILRDTTLVLVPEPIDSTGVAARGADYMVYPNPTHDVVYVKIQEGQSLPARFEVLDLQGRLLFAVPAQETTRVDLSRLPSGVYLLKASDGGRGSAVKITKQ